MEVNELKKKYNELKHASKLRQNELTKRNNELMDLTRDGGAASFDNPLAKQIRILENKLEKAVMKVNEVRSKSTHESQRGAIKVNRGARM